MASKIDKSVKLEVFEGLIGVVRQRQEIWNPINVNYRKTGKFGLIWAEVYQSISIKTISENYCTCHLTK